MTAISRLMYSETTVSNLVALLIESDPAPLGAWLRLDDSQISLLRVEREDFSRQGKKKAFQDLVVYVGNDPVAALEMKISAGWHGDQETKYLAWAHSRKTTPDLWLVTPWGISYGESDEWNRLALEKLLGLWTDSDVTLARELSTTMQTEVLRWTSQLPNTPLSELQSRLDRVLALRAMSNELRQTRWSQKVTLWASSEFGDSGGKASTYHSVEHPGFATDEARLLIDIRSQLQTNSPWDIRFGLSFLPHADPDEGGPSEAESLNRKAEKAAHLLLDGWSIQQIHDGLERGNHHVLAQAIVAKTDGTYTSGLKPDGTFYYDQGGRQKFIKFQVDPGRLGGRDLAGLIEWGIEALRQRAMASQHAPRD